MDSELRPILVRDVALPGETDRYVSVQRRSAAYWLATLPIRVFLRAFIWLGERAHDAYLTVDLPSYRMRNELHELNRQWHIRKRRLREAEAAAVTGKAEAP